MPTFNPEDIDIYPDEFLSACNTRELNEVIDYLEEEGHVKRSTPKYDGRGYDETVYQEALLKLSGKWNMLSKEESEFISNLAKRF